MRAHRHFGRAIFDTLVDQPRIESGQLVRIFADFCRAFAHLGIAEICKIDVVDLQISAADGCESGNFLAKNARQIRKELFHLRIYCPVDPAAARAEMHQRW